MTHLDDDRIVDLALGEPSEPGEQAHLLTCRTCTATREAFETTLVRTRSAGQVVLQDPPPRVWQAIQAELHPATTNGSDAVADLAPPPATVSSLEERRGRRRAGLPTAWLLAAASVVGIVLGVGGTTLANRIGVDPEPSQVTVASASLAPLDSPQTQGVATLVDADGGLRLDLPAMQLDAGTGYLEVWLINRDLTRMISIGVIPTDAEQVDLPVSQRLIDEGYVIVDISREPFDDKPAHSGQTLVRGELSI